MVDIFSSVPGSCEPRPSFALHGQPWEPVRFHRLYRLLPVKDRHQLTVTWQLPSMVRHYRTRPLNYISWLMGHEGRGSILSYLKHRSVGELFRRSVLLSSIFKSWIGKFCIHALSSEV